MTEIEANERAKVGSNNPPSAIDDARTAWTALAKYLADTPVIQDETTAREAKLVLDRGKSTLGDLEAAMKTEADPIYAAWKATRERFTPAIDALEKIIKQLAGRLQSFLLAEEARRAEEALTKLKAAQEAERLAREAEEAERQAKDNASVGEIGVDVATASFEADAAFLRFGRADREAARALKDTTVRLGGGFSKALSMRTTKKAVLDDWKLAIEAIGVTDPIREAILKSAKAYKQINGKYPPGVSEIEERSL